MSFLEEDPSDWSQVPSRGVPQSQVGGGGVPQPGGQYAYCYYSGFLQEDCLVILCIRSLEISLYIVQVLICNNSIKVIVNPQFTMLQRLVMKLRDMNMHDRLKLIHGAVC